MGRTDPWSFSEELHRLQFTARECAPVAKGIEIIESLRGFTSGYAIPQFVIDAPGGGGKVQVNPDYVVYHDAEKIVIRNFEGKIFEYPEWSPQPVSSHHESEFAIAS